MSTRQFAALIGFAFVAAWIALNVGYAVLCLVGAGAFYAFAAVLEGEIDLGELQARVTQQPRGRNRTPPTTTITRTRVQ
ncbi:MAG: hypothetical protein QOC60_602 [Frankiaceae bacterium]|jgi:hypothetical protein|nr:hypothetical protein [Frankiaceae bacterium]